MTGALSDEPTAPPLPHAFAFLLAKEHHGRTHAAALEWLRDEKDALFGGLEWLQARPPTPQEEEGFSEDHRRVIGYHDSGLQPFLGTFVAFVHARLPALGLRDDATARAVLALHCFLFAGQVHTVRRVDARLRHWVVDDDRSSPRKEAVSHLRSSARDFLHVEPRAADEIWQSPERKALAGRIKGLASLDVVDPSYASWMPHVREALIVLGRSIPSTGHLHTVELLRFDFEEEEETGPLHHLFAYFALYTWYESVHTASATWVTEETPRAIEALECVRSKLANEQEQFVHETEGRLFACIERYIDAPSPFRLFRSAVINFAHGQLRDRGPRDRTQARMVLVLDAFISARDLPVRASIDAWIDSLLIPEDPKIYADPYRRKYIREEVLRLEWDEDPIVPERISDPLERWTRTYEHLNWDQPVFDRGYRRWMRHVRRALELLERPIPLVSR